MDSDLLPQSEIAFRVGVLRAVTYDWIKRGELKAKGSRPHPQGGAKQVKLYSLSEAKRLAAAYHERRARRKPKGR